MKVRVSIHKFVKFTIKLLNEKRSESFTDIQRCYKMHAVIKE